ncbi:MAG: methyltransferase domain-containing protein [Chloroflexi bacterium]|nr:methyltransferase domain-containing protein [Chloroflexota bacterium]
MRPMKGNELPREPVALQAHEALAESYAKLIDTKADNALCERPATLSLLPDVKGKQVLDAGCGPGVYSELLVRRGAEVIAIDVSPAMVELAKARLGERVRVLQVNLEEPLTFAGQS